MSLLHTDFTSSELDAGVGVAGHTEFCFEFPEEVPCCFPWWFASPVNTVQDPVATRGLHPWSFG